MHRRGSDLTVFGSGVVWFVIQMNCGLPLQMHQWVVWFVIQMNRWGGDFMVFGSGVVWFVIANESVGRVFDGVWEWGGGFCHCK